MRESEIEAVLAQAQVIPLVILDAAEIALDLATCLVEAGVGVIEVAFRSPFAAKAIESVAASGLPISVSAGTLLQPHQLLQAVDCGAVFGFSPGLDSGLLGLARERDFTVIPGVSTPSESMKATELGHKLQKFFPANLYGGTSWLRSMESPFPETKFVPTGGLTEANFLDYLQLHNVVAVGGSWIVPPELTATRDFQAIYERAKASMALATNK